MDTLLNKERVSQIKNVWQSIRWRMNERRLTPLELHYKTGYSVEHIERGTAGDLIPITSDFLRNCVVVFGLISGRTKYYEETVDILTYEECVDLLKPPPAMPPRQGNFWDYLE
jgi:hypothetical protein